VAHTVDLLEMPARSSDKDGPAGHGKHSRLGTGRRLSTWTLDHQSAPPTVCPSSHCTTWPNYRLRPVASKWRPAAIMAMLAGVAIAVWLGREPLLRGVASLWIVSDSVTHADAIVVLGGNFHVRPRVAADLYQRGLANRILVSKAIHMQQGPVTGSPTDAELNRAALIKLGVQPGAIETFGTANTNTRDEAVALKQWAERNAASAFIIPTEIFSARRVRWIFHREFSGRSVRIEVPSFEQAGYTHGEWWKTEEGVIAFQNELLKYIYTDSNINRCAYRYYRLKSSRSAG
jgi:uncharacterized SAM-binding protein YcdF (DUF218 family)